MLEQGTRSKDLVKLFSKPGHTLNYDQILQVDTSLAESVLKTLDSDTDSVMSANVVREKFIHFSADNIGILDGTVDCKILFMQLKLQHGKGCNA